MSDCWPVAGGVLKKASTGIRTRRRSDWCAQCHHDPAWALGILEVLRQLRLDGRCWNKKRVHRVYCDMGLNMPRRCRKRLPDRPRQPLGLANAPNCCWALDFMHETLYCGRRFRTLNVIDEANRECLTIEIGTSIPSARLIRVLSRLIDCYGAPTTMPCGCTMGRNWSHRCSPNGQRPEVLPSNISS